MDHPIGKHILLTGQASLLGDSLEQTLSELEGVRLSVSWLPLDAVLLCCSQETPDLVLISDDETAGAQIGELTSCLLDTYPSLPIIRVKLDRNLLLVYTSQALPARMADLIDAIRRTPLSGE